jgi:hypothetical protein
MSNSMNFAMADLLLAADMANSKAQATHEMREAEKNYRDTVAAVADEQSQYGAEKGLWGKIAGGVAGGLGFAICGPPCAGVGYALGNAAVDIGYEEIGLFGGKSDRAELEAVHQDLEDFDWTISGEAKKWQTDRVNAWQDRMTDVKEESLDEFDSWADQVAYNDSFTGEDALRYGVNAIQDYITGSSFATTSSEFLGMGDFKGFATDRLSSGDIAAYNQEIDLIQGFDEFGTTDFQYAPGMEEYAGLDPDFVNYLETELRMPAADESFALDYWTKNL